MTKIPIEASAKLHINALSTFFDNIINDYFYTEMKINFKISVLFCKLPLQDYKVVTSKSFGI